MVNRTDHISGFDCVIIGKTQFRTEFWSLGIFFFTIFSHENKF